jgi:hypothetical protein
MGTETTFKVIVYTVPTIMVLGGIFLLFYGFSIGSAGTIEAGWGLIGLGAGIAVLEHILFFSESK